MAKFRAGTNQNSTGVASAKPGMAIESKIGIICEKAATKKPVLCLAALFWSDDGQWASLKCDLTATNRLCPAHLRDLRARQHNHEFESH